MLFVLSEKNTFHFLYDVCGGWMIGSFQFCIYHTDIARRYPQSKSCSKNPKDSLRWKMLPLQNTRLFWYMILSKIHLNTVRRWPQCRVRWGRNETWMIFGCIAQSAKEKAGSRYMKILRWFTFHYTAIGAGKNLSSVLWIRKWWWKKRKKLADNRQACISNTGNAGLFRWFIFAHTFQHRFWNIH